MKTQMKLKFYIFGILTLGILVSGSTLVFAGSSSDSSEGYNKVKQKHVSESKKQFTKSNDEYEDADKSKNEDVQGVKNHQKRNSIEICCTWGEALGDGKLTYRISGGNSEARSAVRSAASEWDSNMKNLVLKEDKKDHRPADINIKIEKDVKDMSDKKLKRGLNTAGITKYTLNWRGLIENVSIAIGNGTDDQEFSLEEIKLITEHELGHALGIGHANFNSSLMSPIIDNNQSRVISECEIRDVLMANAWKLELDNKGPFFIHYKAVNC